MFAPVCLLKFAASLLQFVGFVCSLCIQVIVILREARITSENFSIAGTVTNQSSVTAVLILHVNSTENN